MASRPSRIAILLAFAAPLLATTASAVTTPASFVVENAVSGALDTPVGVAWLPDGRFFVVEKGGRVWLVTNGVRGATPVIARENEVLNNGDRGLLSIAVDPNYFVNHFIYLLYTVDPDSNGVDDNDDAFGRLTRYKMSTADTNVADPASRTILMGASWGQGPCSGSTSHTIGTLRFSTDGSLLISVGDGASFTDTDDGGLDPNLFSSGRTSTQEDIGAFRAQYTGSLAGKILRINPATGGGYSSNPYWDGNAGSVVSRVWCYGLRNPYRFTIRPGTGGTNPANGTPGTLYIGEVGWGTWEECNVAASSGRNFGWPCYEGFGGSAYTSASPAHHGCGTIGTSTNPGVLTTPLMTWNHSSQYASGSVPSGLVGNASIGGVFYTATTYPTTYRNAYFFGDYGENWIKVAVVNSSNQLSQLVDFATGAEGPVDFTTHPITGDVYYVSIVANQVRRIRYTGTPPPPPPPVPSTFPTTAVLDNFNRANGAVGGSWVASTTTGLAIVSNQLSQTGGAASPVWNGTVFGVNQEAFVTLSAITASSPEHDVILKVQGQTFDTGHIEVRYDATQSRVLVSTYDPGAGWQLRATSGTITFAAGNQLGARALSDGTVLVYKNGAQVLSASVSGWPFASSGGRIGMSLTGATSSRLDDFGGGNMVSSGPTNRVPTAVAGATPTSGSAPLAVTFSSAGSSDPDGDPLTYAWQFGDGQSSTAASPAHTYTASGSYTAQLTVSDGRGGQGTASVAIQVGGGTVPSGFPSTGVLDNFNRANGAVGGSWVASTTTGLAIASNQLSQTGGGASPVWNGAVFGADQEAFVTLSALTASSPEHDLILKVQGQTFDTGHLEVRYDATQSHVLVSTFTPGAGWQLRATSGTITFAAGNQFGARALANGTVNVYKNGTQVFTASVSGWAYAASGGRIGMTLEGATSSRLDDFGGGTVATSTNTPPIASISAPPNGTFYYSGQSIPLLGTATDAQDVLANLTFAWHGYLHHNNHVHPDYFTATGSGAMFVGANHDDGTGVYWEMKLVATDRGGLTDTARVNLYPEIDLQAGAISVTPAAPVSPGTTQYAFTIRNTGRMPAPISRWRLRANSTQVAEGDTLVPALDSVRVTRSLPTLGAGTYALRVAVDTLATVVETNESNNASTRALTVTGTATGFPATAVLDNFNRANGAVGGSWVAATTTGLAITSNQLSQTGGGASPVWNATVFGANQEAFVTLAALTASSPEHDLMLKVQGQTFDTGHLEVRYDATQSRVMVSTFTPGVGWQLRATSGTITFAAGNQLGARALANGTVNVYKNGTQIFTASVSGWTYAASGGRIGMTLENATSSRLDDFGGGNAPASVTGATAFDRGTSEPVTEPAAAIPMRLELSRPYPNPSRADVAVVIDLPRRASVALSVHDPSGREIWSDTPSTYEAGHWTLRWPGTDLRGQPMPAGLYLMRARVDATILSRRVTLLK